MMQSDQPDGIERTGEPAQLDEPKAYKQLLQEEKAVVCALAGHVYGDTMVKSQTGTICVWCGHERTLYRE